jgi:hypothetical protein
VTGLQERGLEQLVDFLPNNVVFPLPDGPIWPATQNVDVEILSAGQSKPMHNFILNT